MELEGSLCDCRRECELLCVERDGLHLHAQEAQTALTCLQEQTANERRSLEDQTVQLANQLQEERVGLSLLSNILECPFKSFN